LEIGGETDLNPPAGSKISVVSDGGDPVIVIPAPRGFSRYFLGLFLLFWLGLWTMGFNAAASQLWSGKGNAFLVFWLGAWTLGGLFAIGARTGPSVRLFPKPSN
jgi:hypothetical protein